MKKHLLLSVAVMSAFAMNVWADGDFTTLDESAKGVAISPGGRYVVGINPTGSSFSGNIYMKSFVYDISNKSTQWLTENDASDVTLGGEFSGVADNGVICGTSKDTGHLIEGTAINAAAVWSKDGERTLLGWGDFDMSTLKRGNDGSFANAISGDGRVVAGNFSASNGAYLTACKWTQGDDGAWTMSLLPTPDGAKEGVASAVSADGNVIGGYVRLKDNSKFPILWYADGSYKLVERKELGLNEDYNYSVEFGSISANGEFVTATIKNEGLAYVYNTETNEVRTLPIMDYVYSSFGGILQDISNFVVDNYGNVVYAIGYGGYWRSLLYQYAENRILDLAYYVDIFGHDIDFGDISLSVDDMSPAEPCGITAEGNMIIGNISSYYPYCWILRIEKGSATIPATPSGLKGAVTGLNQVTLYWDKDMTEYDDFKLKSYNIYCNGTMVKEVSASEAEMKAVIDDVPAGTPGFNIEAVYERPDGNTVISPRSNSIQVTVASTWAFPLYEDFSSGGLTSNAWEFVNYEDTDDVQYIIDDSYGVGFTLGLEMTHFPPENPYSFGIVSRPIDATEENVVHLSFYAAHRLINDAEQTLENDFVSIETSVDGGLTWTEQKTWDINSLAPGSRYWSLEALDLSESVAGQVFRVRFRMHGEASSQYNLMLDNISICGSPAYDAPTGLINRTGADGKSVDIAWQDPSNAYKLNFINECPSYRFTLGNEGKELIGANKFEPADLAMFDGKYLTGVTTKINYYEGLGDTKGVRASVVVFEDGKLVREQEAENFPYNKDFTVVLDQPLQIDAAKELMIGVKVFDYSSVQIPLCYVQSLDYLPGKSDLYSEDGGTTWKKVSDFYATQPEPAQGWACWDITGCITDNSELVLSDETEPYAYIVYRNGERVNDFAVSGKSNRFTDEAPVDGACYEVVAYYDGGDYSETSEQMCVSTGTSISNYVVDGVRVEMQPGVNGLTVTGDYDDASLISVNGVCVAGSVGGNLSVNGLPSGVYLLKIEKDGKYTVKKIMMAK